MHLEARILTVGDEESSRESDHVYEVFVSWKAKREINKNVEERGAPGSKSRTKGQEKGWVNRIDSVSLGAPFICVYGDPSREA